MSAHIQSSQAAVIIRFRNIGIMYYKDATLAMGLMEVSSFRLIVRQPLYITKSSAIHFKISK